MAKKPESSMQQLIKIIVSRYNDTLTAIENKGKEFYGEKFRLYKSDLPVLCQLISYFKRDEEITTQLNIDLHKGIVLNGPIGSGKTSLLNLMRQLQPAQERFIIRSCRDVSFEFIKEGYEVIHKYSNHSFSQDQPRIYCFDDLGVENNLKFYGNECNIMAEILLSRYDQFISRKLITHVTTNLSASEIEAAYGNRVRSRMREMMNLISFDKETKDKRKILTLKFNIMKKTIITVFAIITSLNIFAWGKEGHMLVADVAEQFISKSVKDSVTKYLDTLTLEEAAVWMDEIKSDHRNDYMKPWHYINIEQDATYVKTDEKNIITMLELIIAELQDRSKLTKEQIAKNIKMLFHLVGDLHQPLHVGYGSDKGGNDVHVKYLSKAKTNLHHVWDEDIIHSQHIDMEGCMAMANKLSPAERAEKKKIDVITWMNESRALLTNVYAFTGENISKTYVKKNTPVIKRQIAFAGIRLAAVLDKIFK
jgi:energy-coupling factor transporter ATP-binding protein EcfA2